MSARPNYVYVASSWRNPIHAAVCAALRSAGLEHYDFKNPEGGAGFSWREVKPTRDVAVPAPPGHPPAADVPDSRRRAPRGDRMEVTSMNTSPSLRLLQDPSVGVPAVADGDEAPDAASPAVASGANTATYVVHHPPHATVHTIEGTYRNETGRWVFFPLPFPKHGFPVAGADTIAWLDAQADLDAHLRAD